MRWREFITLVGGVTLALPLVARAQRSGGKDPPAVGFLAPVQSRPASLVPRRSGLG